VTRPEREGERERESEIDRYRDRLDVINNNNSVYSAPYHIKIETDVEKGKDIEKGRNR
jgi:hypothetical protein